MYNMEQFHKDLDCFGLQANEKQESQFLQYYEILAEWNKVMNLTAITDFDDVLKKHFVDSLSIVQAFPKLKTHNIYVMDIGTGAGFPGIPLKIMFPQIRIVLLDSLLKRIHFLEEVIKKLDLSDVRFLHGRAEDYARQNEERECYDLCVSRAVANLSTLSELCLPYVKVGGYFISYKSEKISEEVGMADKAVKVLGGKIEGQKELMLPNSDIYRNLLMIKKISKTPKKFPRKAGVPAKTPIA